MGGSGFELTARPGSRLVEKTCRARSRVTSPKERAMGVAVDVNSCRLKHSCVVDLTWMIVKERGRAVIGLEGQSSATLTGPPALLPFSLPLVFGSQAKLHFPVNLSILPRASSDSVRELSSIFCSIRLANRPSSRRDSRACPWSLCWHSRDQFCNASRQRIAFAKCRILPRPATFIPPTKIKACSISHGLVARLC